MVERGLEVLWDGTPGCTIAVRLPEETPVWKPA
jgi:hypothetical protein